MIDIDQLPLDMGDKIARIARRFYPLWIEAAYTDAAMILGDDVGGVALAFDLSMPEVQEVLGELGQLIRRVADTTRSDIAALVGKQAENGWTMGQLADAIEQQGEIRSRERAEVIAATESALAYSAGSQLAWQASSVVDRKEWLTADSPCPVCDPLNGKIVDLDSDFAPGIPYPPAHPRCRCTILPRLKIK